ncbi:MAG TPA: transposase, partial [Tepidisphaeraceae bacterium]|nr:transposase [Tepidisphaeraceae bacterium]
RAVWRGRLFDDQADCLAMEKVIERTHKLLPTRIVTYCLMPTHSHFVLWPREDGELSEFMRLLTVTHTQRWHAHHHSAGTGPLYQGRFKSFPIQQDGHFLMVCRYMERNAVRANLVTSARRWPWCGLARRELRQPPRWLMPLRQCPVRPPSGWKAWVNRPETTAELDTLRQRVKRGRPYGDEQ